MCGFKEESMSKKLNCGEPNCDKVIEGNDEQDVLVKAAAHVKSDHNVMMVNPDMLAKMREAIREG